MQETNVTVVGWLAGDVTLEEGGGLPVARFRVATTPRWLRDGQWSRGSTTWYDVKVWRDLALHAAASLRGGEPVVVHGRLRAENYETQLGQRRTRYVVVATAVGHDLAHGTSAFARDTSRVKAEPATETTADHSVETEGSGVAA